MQFEYNHKIGQPMVSVKLEHGLNFKAENTFNKALMLLGGKQITIIQWEFPLCITSQVIEQVIYNLCYVCGGLMTDGEALDNTLISYDDFGGDAGNRGTTQSKDGEAKLIKVRKCQSCGHSHTI